MGNQASSPERDVYELMKGLPNKHEKSISGHDLKAMLKWVQVNMPAVTATTIFTRELWDDTGVKLWDSATKGNTESHRLLSSWRVIFETIKAQKEKAEEGEEEESQAPIALSLSASKSQCSKPLGVNAVEYLPEKDPFDPGLVEPEQEPDLYPPDLRDVWAKIKKQALKEGDLEMAKTIVAPVLYSQGRAGGARWEALSFLVVKELRRTVMEHGISSPCFISLLSSVFDAYVMTPHDLKSLARLLLTPTQYTLWESHWRGGLQALLLTYVNHNDAASAALAIEHLTGTGARADPVAQAQHCPRAALEAIREEAKKAFFQVPDVQKPQKAFY